MPDYPTNVPPAGWYTDPSNPAQERWWGGVEWTHDVRPLAAPAPSPQPVLANVPGGGINPFAVIDAQDPSQSAAMHGDPFSAPASSASPFTSPNTGMLAASAAPFGSGSAQDPFGAGAPHDPFAVNPSWYDSSRRAEARPEPTNGMATAGLVLSLVGLNVPGIIVSILGLRKARRFEDEGDLPVGRKRSRWGLGLGIASFVISVALLVLYLFAWSYVYSLILEQGGSGAISQTDEFTSGEVSGSDDSGVPVVILNSDGTPAPYSRAAMEQGFIDGFTRSAGSPPDELACPDSVDLFVGSTFTCTFSYSGEQHVMDITFTDSAGATSVKLDGVQQ